MPDSTMGRISAGLLMMVSARYSVNSFTGRNPHDTPTESTHARRAVSISTPESPTYRVSAFSTCACARMLNTIDGSGFTFTPSFCPYTATKSMPGNA